MKRLLQDYYATLTDEELKIASDYIVQQQGQLALMSMCAREERLHRQYVKEKKRILKKVQNDSSNINNTINNTISDNIRNM